MSLFSMMRSRQTPERHCYKNCFPRPAADQNRKQQKIARLNVGPSSLIYCEYSEVSQTPLSCRSSSTPVQKARSIILKNRPSPSHPPHCCSPPTPYFTIWLFISPWKETNITRRRGTVMFWHMYLYTAWGTSDIMALLNPHIWPWHLYQTPRCVLIKRETLLILHITVCLQYCCCMKKVLKSPLWLQRKLHVIVNCLQWRHSLLYCGYCRYQVLKCSPLLTSLWLVSWKYLYFLDFRQHPQSNII